MIEVNRNRTKTDEAWKRLYARLDEDNLLAGTGQGRAVHRKLLLIGGTVAAAVVVGVVYLASAFWFVPGGEVDSLNFLTQENRETSTLVTTLEDGSLVYLAHKSTLQYPEHFAVDKRQVNLQGEAFFDVAKKQAQTFQIETEKVRIEVLGTAFNVRSQEDGSFSLSVLRGKVKVLLKQGGQSVFVNAGETVALQAQLLQVSKTKDSVAFGRYMQNIRFKDECLEDVLRVVNAESSGLQIQTASPNLDKRTLTIEFRDNSPETIAELICGALRLRYSHDGNKLILSE